ncbi:MAG: bifunctional 2-C-methyl-D-erythritol 4-phosphate cytidylyltransferase/2-C-methyl-D-erythritol 2,4-cyclodiphosphate synthase [Kiloniellales bacterium]|nr:bifunctional 2-C-methyl-D-erythritol 4-phosphate cytidylyltransferase/2-C-methyl-D-erythritol 2,4-cyclodiphosphate synthase [Kiloniellales bacterium]
MALVVAAGRGARFGGTTPKQYLDLAGRPLLRHSLAALSRHPAVDRVRAVIDPDDRALYEAAAEGLDLLPPVAGGDSRQDSVRLGLESLEEMQPNRVLIHDGARPFVAPALIDRILAALEDAPGAIAALPLTDTVKRESGRVIAATVERDGLWRAQTPQGFRYAEILAAHRAAAGEPGLTDDAAVAERAGLAVRLVEGDPANLKVTTPADLERAARWLLGAEEIRGEEVRSGSGFDVHRFAPGDKVRLCGVDVPHDRALAGHSDADVGLHALVDAILGALGAGDIGTHFPPSDPEWRGADSALFAARARDLVAGRGGRIVNVDVTLICERPKIGPHRPAMIARIAEILGTDPERVSVKATTTERLGFTGRGEGIAAQATASVALPRSQDVPGG